MPKRSPIRPPDGGLSLAPHAPIPEFYKSSDEKRPFVKQIFDAAAPDYDRIEWLMSMGSGSAYRRRALKVAGLTAGMRVLDVAAGTGLVSREAGGLAGDPSLVLGVDPSAGMLAEAARALPGVHFTLGRAEALPVADGSVDFLSMGYALRHVSDLTVTFREYLRVLRPGGRLCVLEITRPAGRIRMAGMKVYMRWLVPAISRLAGRAKGSATLWTYYWDTIEHCLPPERILAAMTQAGFADVDRRIEMGIFSSYVATRP